jgi:hypothetical protein
MAQPKLVKADTRRNENHMQEDQTATIDEINRMAIRAQDTRLLEIGEYLLDTIFGGEFEKALPRNRRTLAFTKRASGNPGKSHRTVRVKKIWRPKRP